MEDERRSITQRRVMSILLLLELNLTYCQSIQSGKDAPYSLFAGIIASVVTLLI